MKKILITITVIIAIVAGVFVFINGRARQSANAVLDDLETESIRRASLSSVVGATGTVRSNQSAHLLWKVSGQVDQVIPAVGDPVTAGDTLATISETSLPSSIILAKANLVNYQKDLETLINQDVHYFAYPSGDLSQPVIDAVKDAGYRLAFTTSPKKLQGIEEDLYTFTRIKISRTSDFLLAFWVKITGIYSAFKKLRS